MITPHHILYNLALLDGKKKDSDGQLEDNKISVNKRTWAIALGAFFPDSFTFLFFLIYGVLFSMPHEKMWDDIYFNSGWNIVFSLAHSLWLLPLLALLSFLWKKRNLMYFFLSAALHVSMDFFVHTDDAYRHFYPFSNYKFFSPISYYDSHFYGNYVSILTHIAAIVSLFILQRRFKERGNKKLMYICIAGGILEIIVVGIFIAMLIR